MEHSLNCHAGGNMIIRHNKIRDDLGYIASMAFTTSCVRTEPLIQLGCAQEGESTTDGQAYFQEGEPSPQIDVGDGINMMQLEGSNEMEDLLVKGLWAPQTNCA